jgi:hypothetical protein
MAVSVIAIGIAVIGTVLIPAATPCSPQPAERATTVTAAGVAATFRDVLGINDWMGLTGYWWPKKLTLGIAEFGCHELWYAGPC